MTRNLDAAGIRRLLSATSCSKLDEFEAFSSIDSTNTYLLKQAAPASGRFRVAIADQQTAGRGRHSRTWQSPPQSGLYLSLAYTFADMPDHLSALTLALGVGVVNALSTAGVRGAELKWPNDIIVNDAKLGGMLTELRSRDAGITVVAGIGINLDFRRPLNLGTDAANLLRAIDLQSVMAVPPDREHLAGLVIEHLFAAIARFERYGSGICLESWRRLDWLHGRTITVESVAERITGRAAGVADDGALLVDTDGRRHRVISGSVTRVSSQAVPR